MYKKNWKINFICRGNVFRSRLAEAYLKSLNLSNIEAISRGALAKQYAHENAQIEKYTKDYLKRNGLIKYSKDHFDQLTQADVDSSGINVCMTKLVLDECSGVVKLPDNIVVWDVKDTEDASAEEDTWEKEYQETFAKIKRNVDMLVRVL